MLLRGEGEIPARALDETIGLHSKTFTILSVLPSDHSESFAQRSTPGLCRHLPLHASGAPNRLATSLGTSVRGSGTETSWLPAMFIWIQLYLLPTLWECMVDFCSAASN